VVLTVRGVAPLLPGLWPVFAGVSVFASRVHFPRMAGLVGIFYCAAGIAILGWLDARSALHPWVMGLTFTVGQAAAALVFYWNLERNREDAP
jgi:glutathione S-transferase